MLNLIGAGAPSGRDKKKEKEAKASEMKIRKMRPKHNAMFPVQKLNVDNATTDASDLFLDIRSRREVGDEA